MARKTFYPTRPTTSRSRTKSSTYSLKMRLDKKTPCSFFASTVPTQAATTLPVVGQTFEHILEQSMGPFSASCASNTPASLHTSTSCTRRQSSKRTFESNTSTATSAISISTRVTSCIFTCEMLTSNASSARETKSERTNTSATTTCSRSTSRRTTFSASRRSV